jgi:hypothetical protein
MGERTGERRVHIEQIGSVTVRTAVDREQGSKQASKQASKQREKNKQRNREGARGEMVASHLCCSLRLVSYFVSRIP